MMNIFQLQERLKDYTKPQLIKEMQQPSGSVPPFLVLTELQRRTRMEQSMQAERGAPTSTVAEDAIAAAGVPQGGLATMARAMAPKTDTAENTGAGAAPVARMQAGGPMVRAGTEIDMYDYMNDPAIRALANREGMSVEEYISSLSPVMQRIILGTTPRATPEPLQAPRSAADTMPPTVRDVSADSTTPSLESVSADVSAFDVPGSATLPAREMFAPYMPAPSPSTIAGAMPPTARPADLPGRATTPALAEFAPYMETPGADTRPIAARASEVTRDPAFMVMAERAGMSPEELWDSLSDEEKARQTERLRAQISAVPAEEMPPPEAPLPTQADLDRNYRDEMLGMDIGRRQPTAPQGLAGIPATMPGAAAPLPSRGAPPAALGLPGMEAAPPFTAMTPEQREYFDTLTPEQQANVMQYGYAARREPAEFERYMLQPEKNFVPPMTIPEAVEAYREFEQRGPSVRDVLSGRESVSSIGELFGAAPPEAKQFEAEAEAADRETAALPDGMAPEVKLPKATRVVDDSDKGKGGGVGVGGVGGATDIDRMLEQDKWLSLARAGLALMSSQAPSFGQALGEAGAVGLESLTRAREQAVERRQAQELLNLRRAAINARGETTPSLGLSADEARVLAELRSDLEEVDAKLLALGYVPGSTKMGPEVMELRDKRASIESQIKAYRDLATGGLTGILSEMSATPTVDRSADVRG